MQPSKILVVDDFEPLRRFVCSALQQRADFQVIGQAADGLEAIQKAKELQPDLILLDISLPKLNGIAAAQQIRKLAPKSKILFLSENTSSETVEAALSTGASGFVVKSDAGNELFGALEAVIRGGQFVSRRLERLVFTEVKDTQAPSSHFRTKGPAPLQERGIRRPHEVQFYSDEAIFLDSFTNFIATTLKVGNVVIVVATEVHRSRLLSKLHARGLDIVSAIQQGNYIALDVAETLSTFMVNDLPDPVQFSKSVGDLMLRATKAVKGKPRTVAACGECAPVLYAQGKVEAAVRLEQLWDEIGKIYDVDILCGYPLIDFHGNEGRGMFQRICVEHTAVHSR